MNSHLDIPNNLTVEVIINVHYAVYWYAEDETDLLLQAMSDLNAKGIKYRVGDTTPTTTKLYVPVGNINHQGAWVALH